MNSPFLNPGTFVIGCNYWASHAGINMWRNWRTEVVEADFAQMAQQGLQVLRVFPLWPDFQPIHQLLGGNGAPYEVRFGEQTLPDDELGRAGLSSVMMQRFSVLADMAQQHGLKIIAGLLTGWMSGRLYVPPALEGRNVLTDPAAILWELRFVHAFVRKFKEHPAILAWDLGNECNVMAPVPDHEAAYVWSATIANAIRAEDGSRAVISGMHSLDEPNEKAPWRILDQAEILDVLTTHPYPYFTPHCDQDPVNTIRNLLHATAQTRWYGDVGNTAAFCEEIGTLGPMVCNRAVAADYLRTVLYSLWANDCRGLLWWCAYDQVHLENPPYDWHAYERELGLFGVDRSPKPAAAEMLAFREMLNTLPFDTLPPRLIDAVCVLTHEQEQWGAAYGAFVLAKQAGIDLEFQYVEQPIKPSSLYLLPSVCGGGNMSRRAWMALLERVRDGATLLLSHENCMLSPFNDVFGVDVVTRSRYTQPVTMCFDPAYALPDLTAQAEFRLQLALHDDTQAIACDVDGNPLLTRAALGKGWIYFLALPIESLLSNLNGAFSGDDAQPWWQIYALVMASQPSQRIVSKNHPFIGLTEHPHANGWHSIVAINYSPHAVTFEMQAIPGWRVNQLLHGTPPVLVAARIWQAVLSANDALVFTISPENE